MRYNIPMSGELSPEQGRAVKKSRDLLVVLSAEKISHSYEFPIAAERQSVRGNIEDLAKKTREALVAQGIDLSAANALVARARLRGRGLGAKILREKREAHQ